MLRKAEEILKEIENLRKELERLALERGTADQEVLDLSRKLDVIINKFYQALKEKGNSGEGRRPVGDS